MAQNQYPVGSYHGQLNRNVPHHNASAPARTATGAQQHDAEEPSSTLDYALLESLFYNEMMMLGGSSPASSDFLTQQFNEATHPRPAPPQPAAPPPPPAPSDPNAMVEADILRSFDVSDGALLHPPNTVGTAPPVANGRTPQPTEAWNSVPPSSSATVPATMVTTTLPPVNTLAAPPQHVEPLPVHAHPTPTAPANTALSITAPPPQGSNGTLPTQPEPTVSAAVSNGRAKQLVDQFATLASRLGIDLPTSVLQSLTTVAVQNDPQSRQSANVTTPDTSGITSHHSPAPVPVEPPQLTSPGNSETPVLGHAGTPTLVEASTVQELRKTADEAIAAVSKKRASMDVSVNTTSSIPSAAAAAAKHGKRRKKPRLSDCESRLAELKAENELLKRHLENVSNKAHRFDQEKLEAGKRIHQMWEENARPEEMEKTVAEFSAMYSDYGVNRQQELTFHLEQLQRLVNPTNFTKMGLWTMGQDSDNLKNNPIAGILQRELGITGQQGKKILDQSDKIRALCDNLKECLGLLAKLKSLCAEKTQIFQDRIEKCRRVLTSKQSVKLILWIDEHTQLLETVCPGWGVEHALPNRR